MKNLSFILIALLFLISNATIAQVKTELINYYGWTNSVQLSNTEIKLIVVPQIGRIIHFSYLDQENLLYENPQFQGQTYSAENPYKVDGLIAHAAFGGDRIWPTVQDSFEVLNGSRGLSDPWIDGSEWEYELIENGIQITSRVSDYIGAKVTRTITLNAEGTTVTIQQKMEKIKRGKKRQLEPIPLTIWNLSKIKTPDFGLISLHKNSIFDNGIFMPSWPDNINSAWKNYSKIGEVGMLIPDPVLFQKVGADSPGWVAGVTGNIVFGEFFHFDPNETYPDGGTSATIFTCSDFTELECLSPEKKLRTGKSIQFDIQWKLHKMEDTKNLTRKRKQAITWLENEAKK
ncbi:hypothetical protein N9164_13275 [Draconibacterium sp.]|nr:hypothetical protein [Draconibacterium sp.]